jgi:hypothetical protein
MSMQLLQVVMNTQFDSPKYKLMLAQMAHTADEKDTCHTAIGDIAKQCCLNLGKTFQCIQELEQGGYLKIEKNIRDVCFKLNPARISEKGAH